MEGVSYPVLFGYASPDRPDTKPERQTRPLYQDMDRPPESPKITYSLSKKSQRIFTLGIFLVGMVYRQPIEPVMGIILDDKGARNDVHGIRARLSMTNKGLSHGSDSK